jgi:hypothetical protein
MSLILDALKKSEGARLRSDHPAMFESPVARPRATRPRWLSGLVALLVANGVLLAIVLLRADHAREPVAEVTGASSSTSVSSAVGAVVAPTKAANRASPTTPRSATRAPEVSITESTDTPTPVPVPTVTRDELVAAGLAIPEVTLGLHVYHERPAARFVFLNGQKLGEGAVSHEGLRVIAIAPRAVALEYRGSRFAVGIDPL